MLLNYSENKSHSDSREKNNAEKHEEIFRLKKLLEAKEKELEISRNSAFSKSKEVTPELEKFKAPNNEYEPKIEITKESGKESPEQSFDGLNLTRKVPTKAQIKKITQQIKDADVSHQLIVLVNLTRVKGVFYAIKIAKKMGNAYLLDRLHDAIVNDLFEELIKTKKLHL